MIITLEKVNFRSLRTYCQMSFVPKHQKVNSQDVLVLQNFINKYRNILVLTGAGISTESGLPDYRSEGVGLYDRSPNRPIQYKDFISNFHTRKRYWARNFVAWDKFSSAKPNDTHICLSRWEKKGFLNCVVTQNVDNLHQKAGSERIIELHGTSYIVKCLNCRHRFSRYLLQKKLSEINPDFHYASDVTRPDADVDLHPSRVESFNIVNCEKCDGVLKPDVIFFGETVSKEKVFNIYDRVRESDAMLVLGSSLEVYSGYRFVLSAREHGKPVGIVNIGKTRADGLADFKFSARCGELLPRLLV